VSIWLLELVTDGHGDESKSPATCPRLPAWSEATRLVLGARSRILDQWQCAQPSRAARRPLWPVRLDHLANRVNPYEPVTGRRVSGT